MAKTKCAPKHFLAMVLSALLAACPLVDGSFFFLTWVALVPYFYVIQTADFSLGKGLALGLLFGVVYYATVYSSFLVLYPVGIADLPTWQGHALVLLFWLGLSLFHGLSLSITFPLLGMVKRHRLFPLLCGFVWVIIEHMQGLGDVSLPWARLYLGQHADLPLIQSAALLGGLIVSFLIVTVNACLALFIVHIKQKEKRKYDYLWGALGIFLVNLVFGACRLSFMQYDIPEGVKVSLIQANIGKEEKWQSVEACYDAYMALSTEVLAENPDIIVWPESVVPVALYEDSLYLQNYKQFCREHGVMLIVGGYIHEPESQYNAMVAVFPDGSVSNPYKKRHLVPFGEYLPYADFIQQVFPALGSINCYRHELTPGTDPVILHTPYGEVAGMICFDSVFARAAGSSTRAGGEIFVLATNALCCAAPIRAYLPLSPPTAGLSALSRPLSKELSPIRYMPFRIKRRILFCKTIGYGCVARSFA